jgi:hypothetical protein
MAKEPENVTLRHLREIRATLDDHSRQLAALPRIEKQLSDLAKFVRYTVGQSDETQFRQAEQETRIDELFQKLEALLSKPQPT